MTNSYLANDKIIKAIQLQNLIYKIWCSVESLKEIYQFL